MSTVYRDVESVDEALTAELPQFTPPVTPDGWATAEAAWDGLTGVINRVMDVVGTFVDGLDAEIGSLEDTVIKPVSGDYAAIEARGLNCHNASAALHACASNVRVNSAMVVEDWTGGSAAAFIAHTQLFALALDAAGEIVEVGYYAFEEIASWSRALATQVMILLLELLEDLGSLALKIASRFGGWAAWAKLAYDFAEDGLDCISDIVELVQRIWGNVQWLLDLKNKIDAYMACATSAVESMQKIVTVVGDIPDALTSPLTVLVHGESMGRDITTELANIRKQNARANEIADDGYDDPSAVVADAVEGAPAPS